MATTHPWSPGGRAVFEEQKIQGYRNAERCPGSPQHVHDHPMGEPCSDTCFVITITFRVADIQPASSEEPAT